MISNQKMDGRKDGKCAMEFNLNDNTLNNSMQMTLELNAFSVRDDPSMSESSFPKTNYLQNFLKFAIIP